MRSLLLVPEGDDARMAAALDSGADAVILRLQGSAARPAGERQQSLSAAFRIARSRRERPLLFALIPDLGAEEAGRDLEAIMPHGPDGIVLGGARTGADVQHLGAKLAVLEAQNGLPDGACAILPMVTQSAASLFGLSTYAGASRRLIGLAWSAQDLSVALGARSCRLAGGGFTPPCELARTLTLLGARAAGVEPVDTDFPSCGDDAGLRRECEAARRDGFTGKIARNAAQVRIINAVFGAQAP
jgi:citrate lyase subunit beta/citryl-CoA lyase